MQRILQFCGLDPSPPPPDPALQQKIDRALQVADELRDSSAAVNRKLETYLKADKPFIAMLIDVQNESARKQQLEKWDRE